MNSTRRGAAWALKRAISGRRSTVWRLTPVFCAWSSVCGGVATAVVQHPVLGPAPACDVCQAQLDLAGGGPR